MQSILSFGKSIRQFKNNTGRPVFTQAETYPAFFDKHLVHPSRRIKALLNDPNANIRVFYLQYLMLCFEIQNQNYDFYISKLQKFLLDPNFTFLFLEEDDQNLFNDMQFKRFLLEFMEILDSGQFQSTQAALNAYPIADLVFVYFFRSLAIYANITNDFDTYIDKSILFGFLLENFNIDAQMFQQKCIKFIQAQVFVYQQSPQQVYLVFKDIEGSMSSSAHSKLSQSQENQRQAIGSLTSSKRQQKQQSVHQNISMLQQQQSHSYTGSNTNHHAGISSQNNQNLQKGFKKLKPGESNQHHILKLNQFQQQASVLSRNDQQIQSQIQSVVENSSRHYNQNAWHQDQYGLRPESKPQQQSNKQNLVKQNNNNYADSHESKSSKTPQHNEWQRQKSDKAKDEKQTQVGTLSSNDQNSYKIALNDQLIYKTPMIANNAHLTKNQNNQFQANEYGLSMGTLNRQRNAVSTIDYRQFPLDVINRNHSNSSTTDLLTKINEINTRFNLANQFGSSEIIPAKNTSTNNSHYEQYVSANKNENSGNSFNIHAQKQSTLGDYSSKYIPATRDIPTQDKNQPYYYNYKYDTRQSGLTGTGTGNSSSRQSLTQGLASHKDTLSKFGQQVRSTASIQHQNQYQIPKKKQQYRSHIYTAEPLSNRSYEVNMAQMINSPTVSKADVQLYSPFGLSSVASTPTITTLAYSKNSSQFPIGQSSQLGTQMRDLREDSLSLKERMREAVITKLSVSKEFTDSLTLAKMGQPYNSNIKKMKTRSREFRQSLLNYLK